MKYLILSLSLLFISACDIINPEEEIPSFIQINEFQLVTNEVTQGSNTHQITDVWAFVNGEALGVFVLTPTIEYISNSVFVLIEDFEDGSIGLEGNSNGTINRVTNTTQVLSGNGAGSISLIEEATEINSITTFLDLPTSGGTPVYLEMDYRTNVELEVGLVGFDLSTVNPIQATNFNVVLCPIDDWNKVYVNFQTDLELSQLDGYQLAFRASINDTGCGGIPTENPEILLDNVKLIRFEL